MTIDSIRRRIDSYQRGIQSLQNQLIQKSKEEASKNRRIAHINQSITKNISPSMLISKERQIQRLGSEIARIQKKKADLTKQIADKTSQLHRCQQDWYKEHEREQKKLKLSLEKLYLDEQVRQREILNNAQTITISKNKMESNSEDLQYYDVFISHASEDKEDLVRSLAQELINNGLLVWYDEFELKIGDSLRRSIDRGLARSRFGIVVLLPSFFAKQWPQYELDGLVTKEMIGDKVILPLWHKVSKDEVMKYSPSLADKVALSTTMYTIDELAKELTKVVKQ